MHAASHGHGHSHDYVAANREHFDKEAHKFDAWPEVGVLTKKITATMRETHPHLFDKDTTEVLDYACGTGMVSRELVPYVKSIVGVDISGGSVESYNKRTSELGFAPEKMKAVCAELKGEEHELGGAKFDLIVCSLSYHHFASIDAITRTLASFLKPGGSLLVADRLPTEETEEKAAEDYPENVRHTVAHFNGFDEPEMRRVFEGVGLQQFQFMDGLTGTILGKDFKLFIARGVKPL
ncbi:S-adenosyl-L-methionine-dependent methyltransferase [Obba rivulosa]|uniref:S-adenosyl-L-methionine-dependent methyltransferase n=1 Tax=Obba rivulosa TaxID=1052685 RepID=A0A8E2DSB6_9APHY|nr:S-adenosyl-L-methionine-dependent methyltransferase [Obba rivulosa]